MTQELKSIQFNPERVRNLKEIPGDGNNTYIFEYLLDDGRWVQTLPPYGNWTMFNRYKGNSIDNTIPFSINIGYWDIKENPAKA